MATAAIVARNFQITGLKNSEKILKLANGSKSQLLFFELVKKFTGNNEFGQNLEIKKAPLMVTIRKPCVIGYIVEPFPAFPLYQQIQWNEQSLAHFCGTDVPVNKTLRMNSASTHVSGEDMVPGTGDAILWPAGQIFRVCFIDEPQKRYLYFENLVQLVIDGLKTWTEGTSIKFYIQDAFETKKYEESFADINIKVDYSHSIYTVGTGTELFRPLNGGEHNMALGCPEFLKLMQEPEPSEELYNFCMGMILHQFGHVLGLIHENDSPSFIPIHFDREAVINDYKIEVWEEYQGRKNPYNQEQMISIAI